MKDQNKKLSYTEYKAKLQKEEEEFNKYYITKYTKQYKKQLRNNPDAVLNPKIRIKPSYKNVYDKSNYSTIIPWNTIYQTIISDLSNRGYSEIGPNDGLERHHIIPKCMDGIDNEDNIVIVTTKEHTILHCILFLAHPNHYGLLKAFVCRIMNDDNLDLYSYTENIDNTKSMAINIIKESLNEGIFTSYKSLKEQVYKKLP